MKEVLAELREKVEAHKKVNGPKARIPRDLKKDIVAATRDFSILDVAQKVGVHQSTIFSWKKKTRRSRRHAPQRAPQTRKTYTIVGPNGFAIKGLSLNEAKEFLQ